MTPFGEETEAVELDNIARLAENIVYLLPGCPDLVIRKTIQEVYRDFCRRACCLLARRRFPFDRHTYNVVPMYGGVVDCVTEVSIDGRVLKNGVDYRVSSPCTVHIDNRRVRCCRHGEHPCEQVCIETVEFPKVTSESAPSWFIDMYGDYIVCGTLARIQAIAGRAWTDQAQSAMNNMKYENAINDVRSRSFAGQNCENAISMSAVDTSVLI